MDNASYIDLPDRTLLRPSEVASFFRVSTKTVYRWYRTGAIEGIKVKGSLLIYRHSIRKLIGTDLALVR